ncbi:MAG TPA: hypothetical protein VF720_03510, partial [Candidatus Eisenbacteria bacterium]
INASTCSPGRILRAYVAGGGALWVSGQLVFAAFAVAPNTMCRSNLSYEFGAGGVGINYMGGDFPCDFMQVCGGAFMNVRTNTNVNGLAGVDASGEGAQLGFRALEIDRTVFTTGSIGLTDAMFTPTFDVTGGLDTLFTHRAPIATSGMHGKVNAFRYHDPDPIPDQGPVAIFGFPLFFLQPGSVESQTGTFHTARLMIDWLRSEQQRYFLTHSAAGHGRN